MKTLFVRPAGEKDNQKFLDWSLATQGNLFDPAVANYPSTFTLCAYGLDGQVMYMPVQQPFFLESLAIDPSAEQFDVPSALKSLMQAVVMQAHLKGVREVYFLGSNPVTDAFAEKHGFERLDHPIYRLKLSELEKA